MPDTESRIVSLIEVISLRGMPRIFYEQLESNLLLSHKDEFPGRGLKRWRNVLVFSRIWDIARWAGSYNSNW